MAPSMISEAVVRIDVKRLEPHPWAAEVGLPLSAEDREALRLSIIEAKGVRIPLVVWKRGDRLVVLSGTNRLEIARDLGHETVPAIVRDFPDELAAREFALTDNLARRHLNAGQRAWLAYQYQRLLTVGAGRRTDLQPSSILTKVDARKTAAERAGVSEGTISAMKTVIDSGDKDLLEDVLHGKTPVHVAAQYARKEAKAPHLPQPGKNGMPSSDPVLAVVDGDSSDLISNVARLYLRPGDTIYDVTLGRAVFWRKIDLSLYDFHGTDIALEPSVDLRNLPYQDSSGDHLVLDPPHIHDSGIPRYNSRRTIPRDMSHDDIINELYGGGMKEAWRVLKPGGYCWVKCCDEIIGGRQLWSHIEIYEIAKALGFVAADLFILHRAAKPALRHERQCHARKNHSFLWIFRKPEERAGLIAMQLRGQVEGKGETSMKCPRCGKSICGCLLGRPGLPSPRRGEAALPSFGLRGRAPVHSGDGHFCRVGRGRNAGLAKRYRRRGHERHGPGAGGKHRTRACPRSLRPYAGVETARPPRP